VPSRAGPVGREGCKRPPHTKNMPVWAHFTCAVAAGAGEAAGEALNMKTHLHGHVFVLGFKGGAEEAWEALGHCLGASPPPEHVEHVHVGAFYMFGGRGCRKGFKGGAEEGGEAAEHKNRVQVEGWVSPPPEHIKHALQRMFYVFWR